MSESDKKRRGLFAMFTRKDLVHLAISVVVSILLGGAIDLGFDAKRWAELSSVRAKAYVTIEQFAPWNIAQQYVAIVFTQGDSYSEALAHEQAQQTLLFRGFACNLRGAYGPGSQSSVYADDPCVPPAHPQGLRAFYLSAHVPFALRFFTAFFDLLLHALVDQGLIGFLVAAAQVLLGVLLTRLAIKSGKLKMDALYAYVFGLPLAVLGLGSIAAIPLWLVALLGAMALKALPMAGFGAQAGGTAWLVTLVARKTTEVIGHSAIMKQVERVVRH
jgi:hypothetical protein